MPCRDSRVFSPPKKWILPWKITAQTLLSVKFVGFWLGSVSKSSVGSKILEEHLTENQLMNSYKIGVQNYKNLHKLCIEISECNLCTPFKHDLRYASLCGVERILHFMNWFKGFRLKLSAVEAVTITIVNQRHSHLWIKETERTGF